MRYLYLLLCLCCLTTGAEAERHLYVGRQQPAGGADTVIQHINCTYE